MDAQGKTPQTETQDLATLMERLTISNAGLQLELAEAIRTRGGVGFSDLLRAMVDFLPDYLFVKDLESRFLIANKAIAVDLGLSSGKDLIGHMDHEFVDPEVARKIVSDDRRIIDSGEPLVDFEELIITKSGARKWLSTTKFPLRDARHQIVGIVGICRNITDRKIADHLRNGEGRILEMIATDAALEEILKELVFFIEAQLDGITGSILLLEDELLVFLVDRFIHFGLIRCWCDDLRCFGFDKCIHE